MSLEDRILAVVQAIGADIKALRDATVGVDFVIASFPGTVGQLSEQPKWYSPLTTTFVKLEMWVSVAPTVNLVVDVLRNGTTIFAGDKPVLEVGKKYVSYSLVGLALNEGDYLQLNVVSGNGTDLFVRIGYVE